MRVSLHELRSSLRLPCSHVYVIGGMKNENSPASTSNARPPAPVSAKCKKVRRPLRDAEERYSEPMSRNAYPNEFSLHRSAHFWHPCVCCS